MVLVNFVREVFSRKETLETLTTLLSAVLADAATQKQLTEVLKRIVNGAMGDPAFRATLATNLQALLQVSYLYSIFLATALVWLR